jgi:DUF4097 and DUF4098 domain-containing protein YvlB
MRALLLLAAAGSMLVARDFEMISTDTWEWHGAVPRGRAVEVRGITGDIRAHPSMTEQVKVIAHIHNEEGSTPVDLRLTEGAGGVVVCAARKGADACSDNPLTGPDARVDYEVHLPGGVHLVARTINGGIAAESLASDITASTVNGAVSLSTSGTVQARTVNGSIDALLLKPFWNRAPEFSAVNGGIKVRIPTDVSADVHAETRNGRIVADAPGFRGTSTEQNLDGRLGNGGGGCNPLVIRTINGTIELKQRF